MLSPFVIVNKHYPWLICGRKEKNARREK